MEPRDSVLSSTADDRMIQKNTAVSETVIKTSGGYHFHIQNDCNAPQDVRHFERPGMLAIKLWGIRYGHEHCMSFVNDRLTHS
jgi:hypothetical protein